MTVQITQFWKTFTCTGGVEYPFDFDIVSADEMIVKYNGIKLTSGYSIAPNLPDDFSNGGIIITDVAYPTGTLYCIRNTTLDQTADFIGSGLIPPEELQASIDKLTMIVQELLKKIGEV